jgi:hypothetical protein
MPRRGGTLVHRGLSAQDKAHRYLRSRHNNRAMIAGILGVLFHSDGKHVGNAGGDAGKIYQSDELT